MKFCCGNATKLRTFSSEFYHTTELCVFCCMNDTKFRGRYPAITELKIPSEDKFTNFITQQNCLFNYLFARSNGGKFVFRIEDTDLERSTKESKEAVLQDLSWLGLDWDEGTRKMKEIAKLKQLPPVYSGKWANEIDVEVQEDWKKEVLTHIGFVFQRKEV